MRIPSFHAEHISEWLRTHQIGTLPELRQVLGTDVDMTVFRLLSQKCKGGSLNYPPDVQANISNTCTGLSAGSVAGVAQTVYLDAFAPGIFSLNASGRGQGVVLIAATGEIAAPSGAAGFARRAHFHLLHRAGHREKPAGERRRRFR
jgi:hypothetical protein